MSRDYKDEYKKFQSSDQKKKYRAKLNKYNRDKGTYGNGDGKDASHKDGKITGFKDSSANKGKKEKSRLKGSTRKAKEGGQVGLKGGLAKGPSHEEGGIAGVVGPDKSPIEFEGGEIIVNKNNNNAAGKHKDNLLKLNENPDDYEIVEKQYAKDGGYVYPTFDAKNRRQ